MKRQLLAIVLLLAAPFATLHADETDALSSIDACIATLDPQLDIGYDRIAARCPDLAPTLERTGWAAWLPRGWKETRNDLSAGSLAELRGLVARELATRPAERTPRVDHLRGVLTDLGNAGRARSGLWARLKQWIRSFFDKRAQHQRGSWLDEMAARVGVTQSVIEIISYIALGLAVVLAGLVVCNELRLAGVLQRREEQRRPNDVLVGAAPRMAASWSDVERAALAEQPRLLLELIATKLTSLRRLPHWDGLTVREIVRKADLRQPRDREQLNDLALTAERARYAEEGLPTAAVQKAVGQGRELLQRLEAQPPEARPGA